MKARRNYFVLNKTGDWLRGWRDNIAICESSISVADTTRPGVFWSRLLDTREKETVWHRLTMDSTSLGPASVRFSFYTSETDTVFLEGETWKLEELLRSADLTDQQRWEACRPYLRRTAFDPCDVLLHDLTGRYLWFRVELLPQGGRSPVIGNLKLRFPKESWLEYLPEIYQAAPGTDPFLERFLGIFQSLYSDLTEEIREVSRYFDPEVVGGEYLEWLSDWLAIEDGYLWPEDKLRTLIRRGVDLYRIRGTRQYVVEMVKLYTGQEPWVVEHDQMDPFRTDVKRANLLTQLYGESPYMVTMILDGSALESPEAHKALLRIIENAKPAWIEINLVVLTPYLFLDQYSYLGINSTLDRYRPLDLNGSAALPFTQLGDGTNSISL